MDAVLYLVVLLVLMVALLIFLLYNGRLNLDMSAEELNERLDMLEEGVKVIAVVLERLPELVPQFSINQNPLAPLIEAFAARFSQNYGLDSLTDPALRDSTGRFTDGETEETNPA
jgi:hypothetical protein